MSQKTFYRYNPVTEQYERVYPSRRMRMWSTIRQYAIGAAIGVSVFTLAYVIFDFPRERTLRQANAQMETRLEMLERRSDEALAVMEDIAARDNNFYRVLMHADPLTRGDRFAGLERQRYYESLDSMSSMELYRTVSRKLDHLDNMLYTQSKSFDYLRDRALHQNERLACVPAIQPISEKYLKTMASGYGYRHDPVYGTTRFHAGMDFSSDVGTPVYATGDGVVTFSDWQSGYGKLIEINHGYNYTTRYAHLSATLVREGQAVHRGDLIGRVGNTGKSTGPHLHYEVRFKGEPQNPVNYYFMDLTPEQYDEMVRQADNAAHVMD